MEQLLEWMEIIEDVRQHRKVRYSMIATHKTVSSNKLK